MVAGLWGVCVCVCRGGVVVRGKGQVVPSPPCFSGSYSPFRHGLGPGAQYGRTGAVVTRRARARSGWSKEEEAAAWLGKGSISLPPQPLVAARAGFSPPPPRASPPPAWPSFAGQSGSRTAEAQSLLPCSSGSGWVGKSRHLPQATWGLPTRAPSASRCPLGEMISGPRLFAPLGPFSHRREAAQRAQACLAVQHLQHQGAVQSGLGRGKCFQRLR